MLHEAYVLLVIWYNTSASIIALLSTNAQKMYVCLLASDSLWGIIYFIPLFIHFVFLL